MYQVVVNAVAAARRAVLAVHGSDAVYQRVHRRRRDNGAGPFFKLCLGHAAADDQCNALLIHIVREQVVVIDIVIVRIGEKVGDIVADLAKINRKLSAVDRADGIFLGKHTDLIHYLVHHDRGIVALGQVSTCQVGFQIAIYKAALVECHAARLLHIVQQQMRNAHMGYGIHQQILQTEYTLFKSFSLTGRLEQLQPRNRNQYSTILFACLVFF